MSVLIKGVYMPKHCWQCRFKDSEDLCVLLDDDCMKIWGEQNRLPDCPLIELPDHGDLIDRDEIFMQLRTDFAVIERMASEARAMAKDYLDGEKTGMGKAMIRVYEHESIISAERSEDGIG